MGKFICTCGYVSSNVQFPARQEAVLISDTDRDDHTNYTAKTISTNVPKRKMMECAGCGLLWFESKDGSRGGRWVSFMPMDEPLGLVPRDETWKPPSASDATIEGRKE